MLASEAYKILIKKVPNIKVVRCYEYENVFVFQTVPVDFDERGSADELLNTLLSINKATKKIQGFTPIDISFDEYEKGKEVKNFK